MVRVVQEVLIEAPCKRVARRLFRLEDFPKYMKDVREVKILERQENRQISAWTVSIDGVELHWIEEDQLLLPADGEGQLIYRALEGDFDQFQGHWRFSPVAGVHQVIPEATQVELVVEYDLGLPHFEELIGEILEIKVRQNTRSLLQALKASSAYSAKEVLCES